MKCFVVVFAMIESADKRKVGEEAMWGISIADSKQSFEKLVKDSGYILAIVIGCESQSVETALRGVVESFTFPHTGNSDTLEIQVKPAKNISTKLSGELERVLPHTAFGMRFCLSESEI